jgi:signal transduction histidine kinase/ActR/RegA family two-component response regulator
MERRYIQLGQNLTRTIANIVDGDSLDWYLSSRVIDEEYENTLWLLNNIQTENDVEYLYVVRLAGEEGWFFVYDSDDEDHLNLGYFDTFDSNYPEFKEQVMAGAVDPIISETQWGWLLSIYEPVYASDGVLVGYVGADFSMDEIMAERKSYLMRLIFVTLLITADFAAIYILVVRRTIILPINAMARAADDYLEPGDSTLSSSIEALDIRTNDELESLAEAMKSMDRKINQIIVDLKRAEQEAQSSSRARTAFLAQMSHDLRTPMNTIMGMARAVLYHLDDSEKVASALKQVLAYSQRLLTFLNNILDISNIENGKLALSRDIFSMADLCRSLNDLTLQQCEAKNITFFPDTCQVGDIVVWGDRVHLLQAIGTLLNNAVKYTEKGGEVRFLASVEDETAEGVKVHFKVSDTGTGISPERQNVLFKAFAPADREVADKYGATGVKLSICQRIVEMMGGKITVESKVGRGSVFSFEIVFDKADSNEMDAMPAAAKQPAEVNFSGRKILVVDDVKTNRAVARLTLKDTGVDIIEAKDGRQALEIAISLTGEIDLILMDISMPGMDGYEAARAIRALGTDWARSVPIIALTAHTYQEDVDAALDAGMDFHLGKPLNPDILISTIERFFSIC